MQWFVVPSYGSRSEADWAKSALEDAWSARKDGFVKGRGSCLQGQVCVLREGFQRFGQVLDPAADVAGGYCGET
jgi:hypothetical protein